MELSLDLVKLTGHCIVITLDGGSTSNFFDPHNAATRVGLKFNTATDSKELANFHFQLSTRIIKVVLYPYFIRVHLSYVIHHTLV